MENTRFVSTNFQKETGEATAHTAPTFGIHWTGSLKYIPNLLNPIGPIQLNRAVGLKIEDASENFPRASSICNLTALLNPIGSIELNRVHGLCEENYKDHRLSTIVCSICSTAHVLEFRVDTYTHTVYSLK